MSHTIPAIFENGVFRPLEKVELDNGEKVDVILLDKTYPDPKISRERLAKTGEDHDQILYPTTSTRESPDYVFSSK